MAAGAAAVAVALVAVQALRDDPDRIPDGTVVGDLDVGGLRPDVARDALVRHARGAMDRGVDIRVDNRPGAPVHVSGDRLGARPLIDEALTASYERGFLDGALDRIGVHRTRTIPLTYHLRDDRVDEVVTTVAKRAGRAPVPAMVRVTPSGLTVTRGRTGFGVDEETLRARLVELPASITLDAREQPPPVQVPAAQDARRRAQALIATPPTIVGPDGTEFTLPGGVVKNALMFAPRDRTLQVALDPEALGAPLRRAFPGVTKPHRDASFRVRGTKVDVAPDVAGVRLDVATIAAAAVARPGARVPLSTAPVAPKVRAESLRRLGVTDVVGEYTTDYACCEPRTVNIARAVEYLDGTVIPAGGRFSMNETVGERTEDRGFVAAPQIAAGKFEEGIGGGTSQVATTLYNAAFFAGLDLVSHQPHEVYISRYPMGREATISWGSPDLVLRNDWPAPVYIRARASDTSVTIQLFSRALGRRVEDTMGEPTDPVEPETIRTFDPTLGPGQEVVDQGMGGNGFTITYGRKVYRGDTLRRDEGWSWTYRPVNARARYGPDVPEPTPTAPGAPASTAPSAPAAPPG